MNMQIAKQRRAVFVESFTAIGASSSRRLRILRRW
jgi:hypothetical protein